ncbi:MAG: 16S rRNA (cytosine(1402)-N(4))-methyltransferase RsmH [Pseudomonadota bacterium]|nr:16S rRNA (cytosine(1402)-N(4))-methyltransferase RsmH [Pseudomonadota bacterium]
MVSDEINRSAHTPVLLDTFIKHVSPITGTWVDCTFGLGGYTEALINSGAELVIAMDRDPDVMPFARKMERKLRPKLKFYQEKFSCLDNILAKHPDEQISGIVLDIGVSSMQLDQSDRGFSFKKDGPLDMRMSKAGLSAADILNSLDETQLADIIFYYGEERAARSIAREIIHRRKTQPITTTAELSNIVSDVFEKRWQLNRKRIDPATLTFQALRIAVNNELRELNSVLHSAERLMPEGAFLAVVTFHSLEDRLVKHFINDRSKSASRASRYAPITSSYPPTFEKIFGKVLSADAGEKRKNPRARSAKLRIAKRCSGLVENQGKTFDHFPDIEIRMCDL